MTVKTAPTTTLNTDGNGSQSEVADTLEARGKVTLGRLFVCVLGFSLMYLAAVVALVSYKMNTPFWEISWLVDQKIAPAIWDELSQIPMELGALALVAMNFVLFTARKKNKPSASSSRSAVKFGDWEISGAGKTLSLIHI